MVQKQLTAHQVEGHIVESPAYEKETTEHVVFDNLSCREQMKILLKSRVDERTVFEVSVTTFGTEDKETADCEIESYSSGTQPPDHRVAD